MATFANPLINVQCKKWLQTYHFICCLDFCIEPIGNTDEVHMYWFSRDGYYLTSVMCNPEQCCYTTQVHLVMCGGVLVCIPSM